MTKESVLDYSGDVANMLSAFEPQPSLASLGSFKPNESHALYAGTFDPIQNGHYCVLKQATQVFDRVTIAVGVNPEKTNTMFTQDERLGFLYLVAMDFKNVDVGRFEIKGPNGLYQVEYAEKIGAQFVVRGLRNPADFEYEKSMFEINRGINSKIKTVCFMTGAEYTHFSSSNVRGMVGIGQHWQEKVRPYIPKSMWDHFIKLAASR